MEDIYVRSAAEKYFLNRLFKHSAYCYVNELLYASSMNRAISMRQVHVAGVMPAALAVRYPWLALAYEKFLTRGKWPLIMNKWNTITPLPLPG